MTDPLRMDLLSELEGLQEDASRRAKSRGRKEGQWVQAPVEQLPEVWAEVATKMRLRRV